MSKYTLRYKITIPWHKSASDFLDMFRYSESWIEEIISKKEFILRRNLFNQRRSMRFFHKQTKIRWESFGAEVEVLDKVLATEFDKNFRFNGEVPYIEGMTVVDIEELRR